MKRRQGKWWLRLVDLDYNVVHFGTLHRQLKVMLMFSAYVVYTDDPWQSPLLIIIVKAGMATGSELDDRSSIPGKGKRFYSTSQRLECL
jgi:hypothetical protein